MFRPKRDAFYLLQLCFIENVTRFCCYKIFRPKRDAFLLLQLCFAENVARFCCFKSVSSKT